MNVGTASAERGGKGTGCVKTLLQDGRVVRAPVGIVEGKDEGPVLYVQAGQHGMEINGVVAVVKTLQRLKPELLRGTFVGVPVANPLALVQRRPHYGLGPEEPYGSRPHLNMNRIWPGNPNGSEAERLAHNLWEEAVQKADYVIDLHSYERWSASCTIVGAKKESLELAKAFGLRFISAGDGGKEKRLVEEPWKMVTEAAEERGATALAAELAGQWDIYPKSVQEGVRGIENVMKKLGMLEGEQAPPTNHVYLGKDPCTRVSMERDGLLMALVEPGDEVEKDQRIASVLDPLALEEAALNSPVRGIVYHLGPSGPDRDVQLPRMHPFIDKGSEVAVIYAR
ncbi:MAG: succinylglutamate desuccinylase/aspartoacylase family protein [Candidatus Brockarchaeota archaeon]|nr:succinylglutamate desuccinylase/aspartoacylase family protein [Candidatus Brockarchaeota archaeon]